MEKKIIEMPKGAKYLSDGMNTLPYGIVSKMVLGCGGTTLALTDDFNTVVFAPYVSLVDNKKKAHSEIIAVKGGVSKDDVIEQVRESIAKYGKFKIICTYDAIVKVADIITEYQANVLVDEMHLLQIQYGFRNKAISALLDFIKSYEKTTLLTATPISEEWTIDSLKHFSFTEIHWENADIVNVDVTGSKRPLITAKNIAKEHISGKREGNAYIFLNSITDINKVIKSGGFTEEQVAIVCSANTENRANQPIYKQISVNDVDGSKKVVFLTSCAFAGCDLFDESGRSYLVTSHAAHTKIDPQSLLQAAGRIRNSKYFRLKLDLIMPEKNASVYGVQVKMSEFINSEKANIKEAEGMAEFFNSAPYEKRVKMVESPADYVYKTENNDFVVNKDEAIVNIYRVLVESGMYQNRVLTEESINNAGGVVTSSTSVTVDEKMLDGEKVSFKDAITEYISAKSCAFYLGNVISVMETRYSFLAKAWSVFGDKIGNYESYNKLEAALIAKCPEFNNDYKIFKLLNLKVKRGERYTNKFLKEELQAIFTELGIKAKAKASDIEKFYHVKGYNTGGTRGVEIINSKLVVRQDITTQTEIM